MTWRRCASAAALGAVCVLVVPQATRGAEPRCKEARKHFKKSIWWFETDRWDKAVTEAQHALARAKGCDPEELAFVVPYGRWLYRFNPEVYLGVAALNASWCNRDEVEEVGETECSLDADLWGLRSECEREQLQGHLGICRETGEEAPRCGPEVDWWVRLDGAEVTAGLEEGDERQKQVRLVFDESRESPLLADDCEALWSLAPFLAEAILRRENRNRVDCEALVTELTKALKARVSCEPS